MLTPIGCSSATRVQPEAVSAVLNPLLEVPDAELGAALSNFHWTFERVRAWVLG